MRKGTTRPPTIPPELWQKHSQKRKLQAIAEYEEELAAAAAASAAAVGTTLPKGRLPHSMAYALAATVVIPRLPLDDEPSEPEPHREKNTWHPPGCIARKLSKKEMESCPKAKKALDAE